MLLLIEKKKPKQQNHKSILKQILALFAFGSLQSGSDKLGNGIPPWNFLKV